MLNLVAIIFLSVWLLVFHYSACDIHALNINWIYLSFVLSLIDFQVIVLCFVFVRMAIANAISVQSDSN